MAIEEDPPAGVPEWIVSFGDMMSLLLCFFVLLFAMGQTEQQRFQAMANSLREQFGYNTSHRSRVPGQFPAIDARSRRMGSEQWALRENMQRGRARAEQMGQGAHRMWMTRSGEWATEGAILLYEETVPDLDARQKKQLLAAAEQLSGKINRLEVRGHATGRPPAPDAGYTDDWDLSFQRALAVAEFLVREAGIDRGRIRISVAGKSEPLHVGHDPLQLKQNSRVEVLMLAESPTTAAP